jgi:hypothetical protein
MCKLRPNSITSRTIACVGLAALLAAPPASAQVRPQPTAAPGSLSNASTGNAARVAERHPLNPREWQFIAVRDNASRLSSPQAHPPSPRQRVQQHGRAYQQAQRLTAAVGLGILGSLVGGVAGAGIGRLSSEDAMLPGFAVGMCVGAAAGATIGAVLVK